MGGSGPYTKIIGYPLGFLTDYVWGAACVAWGGRFKEDDWVITDAELGSRTPRDFDKFSPPGWVGVVG